MPQPVLIIAWGNIGRRDDGVALRLAERLQVRLADAPEVRIQQHHQLGPELICDLDGCRQAIFVDAHVRPDGPDVIVERVEESSPTALNTHHCAPPVLLSFARAAGYRVPESWLVCVRAYDMEFGDELSAGTARGMLQAEQEIIRLVDQARSVTEAHADA